jgi:hypothetical protein
VRKSSERNMPIYAGSNPRSWTPWFFISHMAIDYVAVAIAEVSSAKLIKRYDLISD